MPDALLTVLPAEYLLSTKPASFEVKENLTVLSARFALTFRFVGLADNILLNVVPETFTLSFSPAILSASSSLTPLPFSLFLSLPLGDF